MLCCVRQETLPFGFRRYASRTQPSIDLGGLVEILTELGHHFELGLGAFAMASCHFRSKRFPLSDVSPEVQVQVQVRLEFECGL
jgi:hypothetical protein